MKVYATEGERCADINGMHCAGYDEDRDHTLGSPTCDWKLTEDGEVTTKR